MLYNLKMSKDEIKIIIYLLEKTDNELSKEIVSYLQDEIELQDRQLKDKINKG